MIFIKYHSLTDHKLKHIANTTKVNPARFNLGAVHSFSFLKLEFISQVDLAFEEWVSFSQVLIIAKLSAFFDWMTEGRTLNIHVHCQV